MSMKEGAMSKEQNIDEEFIESIINRVSSMNLTEEEKKEYIKKILKYIKLKIDYYQMKGMDISLGTIIIGMGIGTTVSEAESSYLPFILGGLGVASILTTSFKRKVKYKDKINNLIKKELKKTSKKL